MKRALQIGLTVLALVLVPSLNAFAATPEPAPAVTLEEIFAPADASIPAELSPAETAIFMDDNSVVVTVCCRGALTVCVASCGGDVDSFSCTGAGSGCTSSCNC